MLLLYSVRDVAHFIKAIKEDDFKDGISFELVQVFLDYKSTYIYLCESFYTYNDKIQTLEIEQLLDQNNFIQLCKIGFLDYLVIKKENFIRLLLAWNRIRDRLFPFALLYQDENDWYDVIPFDSKEAMEEFVQEHTIKFLDR